MVWSRASLVVGVQQHGGLARRLWHSPVAAVSAAAVAKAAPLHCCRLPRHRLTTPRRLRRNCRAALLHGCTAAPICCAAPAAAVTAYCRTAPPRRSVTAPLLPLIVAPLRILPRRRAAPRLLPHRVAPAAPRHSATCCQLCTAPPRCCPPASGATCEGSGVTFGGTCGVTLVWACLWVSRLGPRCRSPGASPRCRRLRWIVSSSPLRPRRGRRHPDAPRPPRRRACHRSIVSPQSLSPALRCRRFVVSVPAPAVARSRGCPPASRPP